MRGNQFYGENACNLLGADCAEHLTHHTYSPRQTNAQKPSRTGTETERKAEVITGRTFHSEPIFPADSGP